jgi:hypothetical protein
MLMYLFDRNPSQTLSEKMAAKLNIYHDENDKEILYQVKESYYLKYIEEKIQQSQALIFKHMLPPEDKEKYQDLIKILKSNARYTQKQKDLMLFFNGIGTNSLHLRLPPYIVTARRNNKFFQTDDDFNLQHEKIWQQVQKIGLKKFKFLDGASIGANYALLFVQYLCKKHAQANTNPQEKDMIAKFLSNIELSLHVPYSNLVGGIMGIRNVPKPLAQIGQFLFPSALHNNADIPKLLENISSDLLIKNKINVYIGEQDTIMTNEQRQEFIQKFQNNAKVNVEIMPAVGHNPEKLFEKPIINQKATEKNNSQQAAMQREQKKEKRKATLPNKQYEGKAKQAAWHTMQDGRISKNKQTNKGI